MSTSGEAAEKTVKIALDGARMMVKLSGKLAAESINAICDALKSEKVSFRESAIGKMVRTDRKLDFYTMERRDIAGFAKEAKVYCVPFCVLGSKKEENKKDSAVCVITRSADEKKTARIIEKCGIKVPDESKVKGIFSDAEVSKDIKGKANSTDDLVEMLLNSTSGGKNSSFFIRKGRGDLSENISVNTEKISRPSDEKRSFMRRSVRRKLRAYQKTYDAMSMRNFGENEKEKN